MPKPRKKFKKVTPTQMAWEPLTLEEEFVAMIDAMYPGQEISPDQRADLRNAFYGGAMIDHIQTREARSNGLVVFGKFMADRMQELEVFGKEVEQKIKDTTPNG